MHIDNYNGRDNPVFSLVEAEVPLADGVRDVSELVQPLGHQHLLQTQAVGIGRQDDAVLHAWRHHSAAGENESG